MDKHNFTDNVKIEQTSRNVITVYVKGITSGWEMHNLLSADRHHDSKYCDRNLEKEHLDDIKDKNGLVWDFGDLFDACNGRYDPRRSYNDLRPEYVCDNYLDAIVADAAKFYSPYANNFGMIGRGNHESSILYNAGIDISSNLIHRLNSDYNGHVFSGLYGGYIRFVFNSGKSQTLVLKYFHGEGTGQSMSRATINKQGFMYADADIIVNGHGHDSWSVPVARERISERGVISRDIQHHVRTPSYQDNYRDGGDGWYVEKGLMVKPLGALAMRFFYRSHRVEVEITQKVK
jgi:hypothetical protein